MATELDRVRHSESDRNELIGEKADDYAEQIMERILTDDEDAREVSGDMIGFMQDDVMTVIIRCALRGNLTLLRQIVAETMFKSVQRVAERRAERYVEELEMYG